MEDATKRDWSRRTKEEDRRYKAKRRYAGITPSYFFQTTKCRTMIREVMRLTSKTKGQMIEALLIKYLTENHPNIMAEIIFENPEDKHRYKGG
jgi:hypothetical protein